MKKDWMIKESELGKEDGGQIAVLMATLDKSCIVSGCAGSGKSILALIKAQRIQREKGDDYQIIVFTKALCNYMKSGRESLGLRKDFYYHEEWRWKKEMKTYANGVSYMVYKRDEEGNKVPNMPKSDYIIVDEIQDFTEQEIREFIQAARKNFYFFGDTAQSIFESLKDTISVEDIQFNIEEARTAKRFDLYNNYRLPLPVAKLTHRIGVGLPPFIPSIYKSTEIEAPRIIEYESFDEQIKAIHRVIETKNLTDVAILLPHSNDVRYVYNKLNQLGGNYEVRYTDKEDWHNSKDTLNFNSSNPKIMTYHSAKGLQFEAIFMPKLEDFDDSQQKSLYVAATRTYKYLYMMWSDYEPDFLSNIPKELYETEEITTIDDF